MIVIPTPEQPTTPDAWPELAPLITMRDSFTYPLESLPPLIRDAVAEVLAYSKTPLEMIATSALTACAACVQANYDVARDSMLQSPTSLYSLVLADSGERKTAVDKLFMAPIHAYDKHHKEEGVKQLKAYERAFNTWEIVHRALSANLTKAVKDGDSKATESAQKKLEASALQKPSEPRVPVLLMEDATQEAIIQRLVKKWPIGYLATAEGGSFFGGHGMRDETIMHNLAMFNSRWDGGRSRVDRATATPLDVDGVRLSSFIMVQPSVLADFMRSAGELARGSGFLARFLFTWPKSTQGDRPYSSPEQMPALAKLHDVMRGLLDNAPPLSDMHQVEPHMLEMSAHGFEAWRDVYDTIEARLKQHCEYSDIRDSASKAAENVARIAAVFHAVEERSGKIQADSIMAAAEVVIYHLREVQRLFDGVTVSEPLQLARALEDWIVGRAGVGTSTSLSDILQFHPSTKLRKKDARNSAIDLLTDYGRARVVMDGRTKMIELNPLILEVRP